MSFHVAGLSAAFLAAAVGAESLPNNAGSALITDNTSVFVCQSFTTQQLKTRKRTISEIMQQINHGKPE
jgi:hypothetical protein